MKIGNSILQLMKDIKYGYIDKDNNKYTTFIGDNFLNNYILQTPEEVINNQIGVCWDQVELERYYFEKEKKDIRTYFIVHYDDTCPTHTFLVYKDEDKYYWFEHSWEMFKGIHQYNNLEFLLNDVQNKFIQFQLNNKYNKDNLYIYEYEKPKYHISVSEFIKHCNSNENIDINNIK